jgi:hypothetical protein
LLSVGSSVGFQRPVVEKVVAESLGGEIERKPAAVDTHIVVVAAPVEHGMHRRAAWFPTGRELFMSTGES